MAALGFTGHPRSTAGQRRAVLQHHRISGASFGSSSISKGNTLQFIDNLTWIHGPHTLKFGGDYRYMTAYFSNVFASSRAGSYTFQQLGDQFADRQSVRGVSARHSGFERPVPR